MPVTKTVIVAQLDRLIDWLALKQKRMWFVAVLLGFVLALGQAPVSFPIGVFTSIPILGYCAFRVNTWKHAFAVGWWAGFGYFGLSMIWLVEPFFVEPEKHAILAPFALVAMSGGLALFWGGAFAFSKQFGAGLGRYIIGLAVAWAAVEYLRSVLFTGFPWGLLGYTWIETPIAQWASVVGPFGLVFMTIFGGLLMLSFPSKHLAAPMVTVLFFGVLWTAGVWRIPDAGSVQETSIRVRLIQPNAPQHQKWDPDWMGVFFRRGLELTTAPAKQPVDLVVWPETSVPFALQDNAGDLQILSDAAGPRAHIIAGIRRFEADRLYNSMVHLDAKGGLVSVYDKSRLVPFGEYVPFSQYLSGLGLRGLAANLQGFSAGDGPQVVSAYGLPAYLAMICYEAIFPWFVRTRENRPEFLLHITNDAWFGDTIGPFQHLVQVQFRAIEQGLPAVRSASTGISAAIDPYGQIVGRLKLNEPGFLDADLPVPLGPTIYAGTGDLPFLLLLFFLGLASKYVTIRSRKPARDQ
ncbi:MAG: apolipoprotein N-acyltransferase [Proteobacteria bacterium]|nr:apolipoprotein N-acyltransferase [Pseudomonadota bacterium]